MRILLAFDTDGTFWFEGELYCEHFRGMIDAIKLDRKKQYDLNTFRVVVVSESPYYPKKTGHGGEILPRFELINDQGTRFANLVKAKEMYPSDICLYIDDQAIWKHNAEQAGFIFVDASRFADMFDVRHV